MAVQDRVQVMVRMPPDMVGELRARARENDRSAGAEVCHIVRRALEADKAASGDNPSAES